MKMKGFPLKVQGFPLSSKASYWKWRYTYSKWRDSYCNRGCSCRKWMDSYWKWRRSYWKCGACLYGIFIKIIKIIKIINKSGLWAHRFNGRDLWPEEIHLYLLQFWNPFRVSGARPLALIPPRNIGSTSILRTCVFLEFSFSSYFATLRDGPGEPLMWDARSKGEADATCFICARARKSKNWR